MDYNITYRQKDKGWQFIISKKENGKWKQVKSKQGFKSKKDAKPVAEQYLKDLKDTQDLNQELKGITFKEFYEMHIEHLKIHLESNTIKGYGISIYNFKSIYDKELSKITTIHIQKCIDDMIKNDLAISTIKEYVGKMSSLFNAAVNKYNIIQKSPMMNIEIKSTKNPKNKKALTENELKDVISRTKNEKHRLIYALAGMCGLRIGEIIGLSWDRVDLKNNIITIDRQWKYLNDNSFGFGDPKSKNSFRKVPITPYVRIMLIKWNIQPINIDNRLFSESNTITITNSLKNNSKKLGYDITIHEYRHTYATTLIANGIDFKTVAQLMGHDVKETMKTYSHVTDDMIKKATNTLNSIFK